MTDENKYHEGERLIKKAVAMRFMLNAALSLLMAISYSGTSANLYRINASLHFVLHFLVHWYGYLAVAVDILNIRGIGAFFLSFMLESVIWIIGLITLILAAIGRKKCRKAAL